MSHELPDPSCSAAEADQHFEEHPCYQLNVSETSADEGLEKLAADAARSNAQDAGRLDLVR